MGVYEVTFAEWDACFVSGSCRDEEFDWKPNDEGWGRDTRPVINVIWNQTQFYVNWLSAKTGKGYRLLSESEWEYAARAGSTGRYHWGDEISPEKANYGNNEGKTLPVGSYPPNDFGLYDMHGNITEWVEDCSESDTSCGMYPDRWGICYKEKPADGSARRCEMFGIEYRGQRGGSWKDGAEYLRSAARGATQAFYSDPDVGFRVARGLE